MEVEIVQPAPLHRYGSSFLLDAVNSAQRAQRADAQPRDELKDYLASPLENTDNILHYWGVSSTSASIAQSFLISFRVFFSTTQLV